MHDATFAGPDLTMFCRLDEFGLEVVGQRLGPDPAVPTVRWWGPKPLDQHALRACQRTSTVLGLLVLVCEPRTGTHKAQTSESSTVKPGHARAISPKMFVMTRDRLRCLLSATDGEAVALFTSRLDDSGSNFDAEAERTSNSTANLLTIYRRRTEHVRRIGLPTLVFDETVANLESTRHERLRLALCKGPGGHPSCVAFLADDRSDVVAVLAVLGPPRRGSTRPLIGMTERFGTGRGAPHDRDPCWPGALHHPESAGVADCRQVSSGSLPTGHLHAQRRP